MEIHDENRALGMLRSALGPIQSFFDNPNVVELYVNDDKHLSSFAKTVANREHPLISAELPFYGYRFEGSLPPVSVMPGFNIRKPAIKVIPLEQYVTDGIMSAHQRDIIVEAVRNKQNILLVGGTGSGKTTAANAILNEISKTGDRILILEDTRELQCSAQDYESFRTQDNVSMTDLVKTAMRRRPDRIVVGEVRDKSALDLLKAWNTGHPGGVCTVHANSAADGLLRLEQLIQEAIPNSQQALIGEAVDLIIYISRTTEVIDGKTTSGRKVKEVCRCYGYKNGEYQLEYIS